MQATIQASMRLRIYVSVEEHDSISRVDRQQLEALFVQNMHRQYPDPASINAALLHSGDSKQNLLRMYFDFKVPLELQSYVSIIKLIARRKGGYTITRKVLVETAQSLPLVAPKGKRLRRQLLSPECLFIKPSALIGMIQRELVPDGTAQAIERNLLVFDWAYIPPAQYPVEVQEHPDFQRVVKFYQQIRLQSA